MNCVEESQKLFYRRHWEEHQEGPRGVAWRDLATQELRFSEIMHLMEHEPSGSKATLHEVGCGLAHLKGYLDRTGSSYQYSGSDILPEFLDQCQKKYPATSFTCSNIAEESIPAEQYDYICLSGTFHTIEDNPRDEWRAFIEASLRHMYQGSSRGICFNLMSSLADHYDPSLYYADPAEVVSWCQSKLSRFVSLRHATPLYEFFVYVYHPEFMQRYFPEQERYFSV